MRKTLKVLAPLYFLLLSSCYWQEQLCYMGKDPELIQTESYYNDCKAINDSALRGELVNRQYIPQHPAVAKSKTVGDTFAMKHLLTTALMFFCLLVTPSWSWEKVFKCENTMGSNGNNYRFPVMKVTKRLLSKPKIWRSNRRKTNILGVKHLRSGRKI